MVDDALLAQRQADCDERISAAEMLITRHLYTIERLKRHDLPTTAALAFMSELEGYAARLRADRDRLLECYRPTETPTSLTSP